MYRILESHKEQGTKVITDDSYHLLRNEQKKWYYRDTDEDGYIPTSNQSAIKYIDEDKNISLGAIMSDELLNKLDIDIPIDMDDDEDED